MSDTLNSAAAQDQFESNRPRLLIEDWLPIGALGIESVRERTPMTPFPAPNRLHVWWARRPLVAARAAVLGSILSSNADKKKFMHVLGIHGDPVSTKTALVDAKRTGQNLGLDPYGYKRAFTYLPDGSDRSWILKNLATKDMRPPVVLDSTAGGGSIPFEALRLGAESIANDLNPVAWTLLKATVEFPAKHGNELLAKYGLLSCKFKERLEHNCAGIFPSEDKDTVVVAYLWARTITCPYCAGVVPLAPNWKLNNKGKGVRIIPFLGTGPGDSERHCSFDIVEKASQQSFGTIKGGDAQCPYPDCLRSISGDVIKAQAKKGEMGQQPFSVVFNKLVDQGRTKQGKPKRPKKIRGFRAPRAEDDNSETILALLNVKIPEWVARDIIPTEMIPDGLNTRQVLNFGLKKWTDFFSPRQLLSHAKAVEIYRELMEEHPPSTDLERAAFTYLAITIDKMLDWNSLLCTWHPSREVIGHTFQDHHFCLKMTYAEMPPAITGLGCEWAINQISNALKEMIVLTTSATKDRVGEFPFESNTDSTKATVINGSASSLALTDNSVDAIVVDPPYYDNVMYADLSDFFYVWMKRTVGPLFPEQFFSEYTNKDDEAVANASRFKDEVGGAKLARRDYQEKMAAIFQECHRLLKSSGVLTVMFTHKASGAWDALATGIVESNFTITASWPVNSEAEGSLRIREKSAARSTIFLVCRPKLSQTLNTAASYWEDIEPQVTGKVRERLAEFQEAGITGVDLYLACFGPALQVFSEAWPLTRGTPVPEPKDWDSDLFKPWDPYTVRPEDALDAARREVKRWRMDQLATITRQHHLDELTEFFILAWDAFRAPRFPADEALKLARVVGLDFDRDLKNVVCEVKGGEVILWDSHTRQAKGKLGPVSKAIMLDTLHHAALASLAGNTGTAKDILERAKLLDDPTLKAALQALLNVLPPTKGSDFEALNRLRGLAFPNMDVSEAQMKLYEQTSLEVLVPVSGEEETAEDE